MTFHQFVRYAEIAIVGILSVFALLTYLELTQLRKAPVALPTYAFETQGAGAETVLQARGTWMHGGGVPQTLQTTIIECRNATMRCVESAASVVPIEGKALLESRMTEFEIDRWTDREIVTKPHAERCETRVLSLGLADKRVYNRVTANKDDSRCTQATDRVLELVAGYRLREPPR